MVFVKTMKRKNKDGSIKTYYYLAENKREQGKIKIKLLQRISEEEAKNYDRDKVGIQVEGTSQEVGISRDKDISMKDLKAKLRKVSYPKSRLKEEKNLRLVVEALGFTMEE